MPLSLLFCGAATSQVINQQVQLGDVFTEQTMDVVDVSDAITMTSASMGNGVSASNASGGPLKVTSSQDVEGRIEAHAVLSVSGTMGTSTVISTSATGNSTDTGMLGGALSAGSSQYAGAAGVLARGQTEAAEGSAVDFNETTQAVNNSFGMGLTNAAGGARLTQVTDGGAMADGGAIVGEATGQATVAGMTAGNDINLTGINGSAYRVVADQTNRGDVVQASKFTAYGSSYLSTTAASSSANNLHATNQGGALDVTNTQTNSAYVRAQAEETSAFFSAATANAYGVGNSLLAGSLGPDVTIVNDQTNTDGGIEATASFGGGTGYDGTATATAMGNAATGYACSECSASLRADNHQINSADVSSTAHTNVSGPSRSVLGTAASVGNNASYYVSAPTSTTTQ